MRALAILAVLASVAGCGFVRTRPCRALEVPKESAFERCGGMLYHAPPGASAEYGIRVIDAAGEGLELRELCVLLDGAPIFASSDLEATLAAPKERPAAWSGRVANARHTVAIQAIYGVRGEDVPDPTHVVRLVLRAAHEVAPVDGAVLELVLREVPGAKPLSEERLTIEARLPNGTAQPRCE